VRPAGEATLGTRAELKNINSFRFVAEGIDLEIRRQIALLERGERVRQQTRGYNADRKETYLLRDKENEAGYRYFPEPDLPPLAIDEAFAIEVGTTLPELPEIKRARFVDALGLTPYAATVVTGHPRIAAFFEEAALLHGDPVKVANFIQGEVLRDARFAGLTATFPVRPGQVAALLRLVDEGTISGKQAKEVFAGMAGTDRDPADLVREKGMAVITDTTAIERIAAEVIAESPKQAAAYRGGKAALLGFFVGQVMKRTGGSASPAVVNDVLRRLLA
jgi:aspartyl-tRNA(Asn)/glutamyl-tRNA(Gln) amidotransferase subunit B